MERIFNLCEAGLWSAIAVGLGIRATRTRGPLRRILVLLAVTFFIFGISDVIEMLTGAWWQPWWLAALKIACGIVLGLGFWKYYAIRKAHGRGGSGGL